MITKTCFNCKKEFLTYPSLIDKKYCSISCYNNSKLGKPNLKKRKDKILIKCSYCGKKSLVVPSKSDYKYCSKKCYRLDHILTIKCSVCGKIFTTTKGIFKRFGKKFCSSECSHKYHTGKNHPLYSKLNVLCHRCGKLIITNPGKLKHGKYSFCSPKCHYEFYKETNHYSGNKNPSWKGGKYITSGYVMIYSPNHPRLNKLSISCRKAKVHIQEHILIVERCLGRYLSLGETVHHINGIKDDNRSENLYLFDSCSAHIKFHMHPHYLVSNII